MSVQTPDGLAAALLRRPVTPLRLRKFARVAKMLNPAIVAAALLAIPDLSVRAQVAGALRDVGLEA